MKGEVRVGNGQICKKSWRTECDHKNCLRGGVRGSRIIKVGRWEGWLKKAEAHPRQKPWEIESEHKKFIEREVLEEKVGGRPYKSHGESSVT